MKKFGIILLLFSMIFITSCSNVSPNTSYQYINTNNQNNVNGYSLRLYASNYSLYYLSNDGYYKSNTTSDPQKVSTNHLIYCLEKDGELYARTNLSVNISSSYEMANDQYDYLIRINSEGKMETLLDRRVDEVYYTAQYIFFSEIHFDTSTTTIYRCDYDGKDVRQVFSGDLICWMVTNEIIMCLIPEQEDICSAQMLSMDFQGNNQKEITTISQEMMQSWEKAVVTSIQYRKGIWYYSVSLSREAQNTDSSWEINTLLYEVSPGKEDKLILQQDQDCRFVFTNDRIFVNTFNQLKTYKYDGTGEQVLYSAPNNTILSSPYYVGNNYYIICDTKEFGTILKYQCDTGEISKIIQDIPICDMIQSFLWDGYIP